MPPRIDFYILPNTNPHGLPLLACRLTDKAFRLGQRVHIHTASADQAHTLDTLLWTFAPGSFVPHRLLEGTRDDGEPITLHWTSAPPPTTLTIINLSPTLPPGSTEVDRIIELVDDDPMRRDAGRERYRYYRQHGYILQSHNLGSNRDT